nr:MAG TPA: hypothetical protein [Caudoviricetes sp.]
MAIRLQQIAAPNFAGSNQLLLAANQQIGGALQGLQDTLGQYRDEVVRRNTAQAVGLLTGATDANDLAQRQQQVAQLVRQGDIDPTRVSEVAATMPDTLLGRQTNQMKLNQLQTAQHDAPLLGQYMQAVMAGDQNTAKGLLSQFQGDASSALSFAADWQNKQAQLGIQRSELGLRQAQLNASLAAARAKSSQNNALLKALPGLLNTDNVLQGKSDARDATARTSRAQDQLTMNPVNNPKLDPKKWISDNSSFWGGSPQYVYNALSKQPGWGDLNQQQQLNLLQGAWDADKGKAGNQSTNDAVTDYYTKAMKSFNDSQLTLRKAQDDQDRQAVLQDQRERLNKLLLPLLLQQ